MSKTTIRVQRGAYERRAVPGELPRRFTVGRFVPGGECPRCAHAPHLGPCGAWPRGAGYPCPCVNHSEARPS